MKKKFLLICFTLFSLVICRQGEALSLNDTTLSYNIKPGDTLEISVYGEPDLNKIVNVSENGKITYPFIGEIEIAGLSIKEAANKMEALLRDGYLVNPQVSIFIKEYARFMIVGAVRNEGRYELKGNLALMDGIALAQGAKDNADLSRVKVVRKKGRGEQEYIVDLETQGKSFLLEPADKIIVEEYGKVSVLGAVTRSDNYHLKKNTSLFDILALAGGAKDNANLSKIAITRKQADGSKEYVVDLNKEGKDFILKSGDTVYVNPYEKISVLGSVQRPGSYDFRPGLTAVDAIASAGGFTEFANRNGVKVIRMTKGSRRKTFNVPVGDILNRGDKSRDLMLEEGDTVSVSESMF